MTFRVSLLIDADGKAAVQEVRRLEKAQKDAGAAADTLGSKTRGAKSGVDSLSASARVADAQVDAMAAANQRAAGSMGNLVAQGNDVITMLIAGQDPMQLAIQQGTQINQVWGQMGVSGTGAFKAIGGALMSMLSPINLITIGSIAAAGAMVGWFTSGSEEAATFQDQMDALETAMSTYSEAADAAEVSTDDLSEKFGTAANEVRRLLVEQRDAARRDLTFKIKAVIEADLDETSLDLPDFDFGDQRRLSKEFDLSLFGFDATARRERQALINEVLGDYAQLAQAAEGSVSDQVAAVEQLLDSYGRAARASGKITRSENDRIQVLQELLIKLQELAVLQSDDDAAAIAQREAYAEYYQSRVKGEEYLRNVRAAELEDFQKKYEFYAQSREQSDAQLANAEEMLAQLQEQNALQALIVEHGADSAEVAEARADAERAVFEEMLASLDVSEDLKNQLRAAFEEGLALSNLDVGAGIRGAVADAAALAQQLGVALSVAMSLQNLRSSKQYGGRGGDPRDFMPGGSQGDYQNRLDYVPIDTLIDRMTPRVSSRGGGGGGRRSGGGASARTSEIDRERKAVEDLLKSLQDQLDILRETDPVQQELLRNREALKGATDAERDAVEDLIETRLREEEALENHKALVSEVKDIGYDLFTSATQGADALEAAARRAAEAIQEMVFQAILLGEGPLAGLLGGNGGLLTGLAEALAGALGGGGKSLPAKAAGGMIYGPGDGTSDDVLMWGSSGEFVVNARATARHRGLLEQINAGALPAYAGGGMIPGPSGGSGDWGAGGVPTIIFENNSSTQVQHEMQEVRGPNGGRAFKFVLADQVGQALTQPGGGARRALQREFGIQPRGTRR